MGHLTFSFAISAAVADLYHQTMAQEPVENVYYKVIVLGDAGVGKTALILRFVFATLIPK